MKTDSPPPHLLILDGHSILRRLYEAIRGKDEDSAAHAQEASASALAKLKTSVRWHQATHALVAFDPSGPCWRADVYPAYKAHRTPAPQPFSDAIEPYRQELLAHGFQSIRIPGFEADDAINTLALKALARGYAVTVESKDKDLTALVAHGAQVFDPFERTYRDASWIAQRFNGIRPEQVTDYLALCGDHEDGIPGIPNVGPAMAAKLLKEHTDLPRVLSRADSIVGALGKHVRAGKALATLSHQLASMRDDVPIGLKPSEMRVPL